MPTEGLVEALRRVKDDGEVARMAEAARIADEEGEPQFGEMRGPDVRQRFVPLSRDGQRDEPGVQQEVQRREHHQRDD